MSHLDYALAHTDWHAERQAGDDAHQPLDAI